MREVASAQQQIPPDLHKVLQGGGYPRRNHLCNFYWRSVKGFESGGKSDFTFRHWL